jgi:CheY-like chemotaxis protein
MARVAVVNDDTEFLGLMAEVLEAEGYEVLILREADHAFASVKQEMPDLVVLDVRMESQESGWTIAELLTLHPDTRAIPVIVCSADVHSLRENRDWLAQHGIGALAKPFDLDDLLGSVTIAIDSGEPRFLGLGDE